MKTGAKSHTDDRDSDIEAIKACLDQLGNHVELYGLLLAANLIGAASRAITAEIAERRARNQDWTKPENRVFDA